MTDSTMTGSRGHRLLARAPLIAALLAGVALLLLALVPFGWRFGLWHFSLSFRMVAWAQDLALAGGVIALLGLVFGGGAIAGRSRCGDNGVNAARVRKYLAALKASG